MNVICKMKFGSHLYGTSTPASDTDCKGIYLPTQQEIATGKYPKCICKNTKASGSGVKNSKEDIDYELYSLQYFIDLACQGETVALDMLHAPGDMLEETSAIWQAIQNNRARFYTKNLNSFVGYARAQAAKYGIKGSRLNEAKAVIDILKICSQVRLDSVWHLLPIGEHSRMILDTAGEELYQVCGKKFQRTAKISFALESMRKYYEVFGARARMAADNEGIDWKAISHAMRACMQVKEILISGDLKFPLKDAAYLLSVKQGQLDYKTVVAPKLEADIEELEAIAVKSPLPAAVDRTFWDSFLRGCYFTN